MVGQGVQTCRVDWLVLLDKMRDTGDTDLGRDRELPTVSLEKSCV